MPNSGWTIVTGADAEELETGMGPEPEGNRSYVGRLPTYNPQPPATLPQAADGSTIPWMTTRIDLFTLVKRTGVPPAVRSVVQVCDRCYDHVDRLAFSDYSPCVAPYGPPEHVSDFERGERSGTLYSKYRVRGKEKRRTILLMKLTNEGPSMAPGTGFQNLFDERPMGPAIWEEREIDQVVRGAFIEWHTTMEPVDCLTGMSKRTYDERSAERELVAMLQQAGSTMPLLNDGDDLAEVLDIARQLDEPRFVVDDLDGATVVALVQQTDDGDVREIGRAKIRPHKGGFTTLAEWKPTTAD